MKYKMKLMIALAYATTALANSQDAKINFMVKVVDDGGSPLKTCEVVGTFFDYWEPGEGFGKDIYKKNMVKTADNGLAEIAGISKRGDVSYSAHAPAGFYKTWPAEFTYQKDASGKWIPENKRFEVILKRIKDPIPMYAKNLTTEGGGVPMIPARDKAFGYDFEVGDWVAPEGKGVSSDILFQTSFRKEASGDSARVLRISFPGKEDGLIAFDQSQSTGSEFSSDYFAPENGYQSLLEIRRTIVASKVTDERKRERNYYFRIRSKVDSKGNLVSANYGKIYGDFISFIYYFNPTPNDRNVEFDPKKNLFRDLPANLRVDRP